MGYDIFNHADVTLKYVLGNCLGKSTGFPSHQVYVATRHDMQHEFSVKKNTSSFSKGMAVPVHAWNVYFFSSSSSRWGNLFILSSTGTFISRVNKTVFVRTYCLLSKNLRINTVLHVWIELLSHKICYTKLVTWSSRSGALPDGNK